MQKFSEIIGQKAIKDHIYNALRTGSVSHAYILNGDAGSGRKTIAYTFAAALQCEDLQEETAAGAAESAGAAGDAGSAGAAGAGAAPAGEPERYLDYIHSTGTEYINTGVRGRSDTKAEIEMEWCEVGEDWSFLDARGSISHDTDPNSRFFMWHTSLARFAYGYVSYARQDQARAAANTRYHVVTELARGRQTLTVNGQLIASGSDSRVVDAGCNLYVFVANIGDSTPSYFSKTRLYRLKLWQKATDETDYVLLRDFRPAIAKDGTIGLWEIVSQRFYPSAGTPFALNGAQTTDRVNAGAVIMVR